MEGIVRELGGRKVIQFENDPGEFVLFGKHIKRREYNGKYVCSLGEARNAVSIGTVIEVNNGKGCLSPFHNAAGVKDISQLSKDGGTANALNPFGSDLQEIINILIDIRNILKEKKEKPAKEVVKEAPKINTYIKKEVTPMEDYRRRCEDMREIYRYYPDEMPHYQEYLDKIKKIEEQFDREGIDYGKKFNYAV